MKNNSSRVLFFTILNTVIITLLGCKYSKNISENDNPNVIVIMTDDLGYVDVGFNGSIDIPTPNIDRIAHQRGIH